MPARNMTPTERFWEKVELIPFHDCWEWIGPKNSKGYGVGIMVNGRQPTAHRQSYEIHKGSINKGMCICHSCDNRSCVNPNHLWIGTHADNVKDRDNKKRRNISGEGIGTSKLTKEQVLDIRSRPRFFGSQVLLGKEFGVTTQAINLILSRKNWFHC